MAMTSDDVQNLWSNDFVQKNPRKSYHDYYPAEYAAVSAFVNGGAEPAAGVVTTKLGMGIVAAEKDRRAASGGTTPPPAATKPSIPTGFKVTPGDGKVTLTWNPNPAGENVDVYQIYQDDVDINLNVQGTTYTVTGLTNGQAYGFRVGAHNSVGYGDWTNPISATPVGAVVTPPPAGGIALDTFDDFANPDWTSIFVNRYKEGWTNLGQAGTPWGNGGGIFTLTNTDTGGRGSGFKFVVNADMIQPNASGKCAFICDRNHLTLRSNFLGQTQDFSGEFMFPASGNVNGFPSVMKGVLWEWHTESMSGAHVGICVYEQPDHPWFRSYDVNAPGADGGKGWYFQDILPNAIVMNRWYKWRMQVKWSYGSDGFFRAWMDGVQYSNHTGPTLRQGEFPYLQFGYYAHTEFQNEVWHANIRKQPDA